MITIPTITQLQQDIQSDIESEFDGLTIPDFGKNFIRGMSATQAGKLYVQYLTLGRIEKNIFPDTAESELLGGSLERFGRVKLGRDPFEATSGIYSVQVTGSNGAIIPASMTFKSNDDSQSPGKLFILDEAFTLDGINIISLRALEAGLDSKLIVGNELTATGPIALVDDIVTVTAETTEPKAAETTEEYREKIIEAFRLEAQGGAGADYRLWAANVQGVNTVYPYAKSGVTSEINLFVEATIADSTDGKGTPSAGLLSDVEDAIELPTEDEPSKKPLTAIINYLPVAPLDVDIQITGFVGITAEIETLVFDVIKEFLDTVRPFVSSIDVLSAKNDIFDVNKIIALILQARPGSTFGAVQLTVDGNVVSTFTFEGGDIPYLNSITYV